VKRAGEVHAHDAIELVVVERLQRARHAEAGVGEHGRQPAEGGGRLVDGGGGGGGVGDVGDDGHPVHRRSCLAGGFSVEVEHRHQRALGREPQGGRPADAVAAAGDERSLPGQQVRHDRGAADSRAAIISATICERGGMPGMFSAGSGSRRSAMRCQRSMARSRNS
jgi:hypothetical protein